MYMVHIIAVSHYDVSLIKSPQIAIMQLKKLIRLRVHTLTMIRNLRTRIMDN